MISNSGKKLIPLTQASLLGALLTVAGTASAATYNLCAGTTDLTMPDSTVITMWGYGLDTGGTCAPTIPGPELTVPPGDNTLTVNLRNELSEPVSMIISGQQAAMTPVFFTDGQGRQRVRSFTHETSPGGTAVYSWNNLKPGTFLYSSGTHPAVQVQMGLYGSLTHDAAAGEAYAGIPYDTEVMLIYSEIDPALHAAVAGGTYGTSTYPSTVNYAPQYFLVNGAPYEAGITPPVPGGAVGDRTLIRFLNAGLEDHSMVLQGQHMNLVAEDGNAYPWKRRQFSVLLAAGKTKDAIFTPASETTYPVYDRRLRVGMMTNLSVSAGVAGPTAVDDTATVAEDSVANSIAVLANDTVTGDAIDPATVEISSPAVSGQAVANADGTVSYTPNPDFSGTDGFSYTVRDTSGNLSNPANVAVTVTGINDNPVAGDDAFAVEQDSSNNSLDVLANDTDVDGDALTITTLGATDNGGSVTTDGLTVSYTPAAGFSGVETFSYDISDGNGGVDSATVTVTVNATVSNQPPQANDDYGTVTRNTGATNNSVTINVVANDTDADGTVDATSVVITANPLNGTVVNNGDGTVTYTPNPGKRGADAFGYTVNDDLGATSNEATVRVDIVK
ncbi:MAG: Ig-like domain-containing protein [Pseudomonadota bacterium]